MRITVLTGGSRGDVQPLVALASGLIRSGYDVRVIAHKDFRPLVEPTGVEYIPLPGQSPREVWADISSVDSPETKQWRRRLTTLRSILRTQAPADTILSFLVDSCRDSDAVVFSHASFYGALVAEHLGVPSVAAYLYPVIPSSAYPPMIFPFRTLSIGYVHRLLHLLVAAAFWYADRPWVNTWRTSKLNSSPLDFWPNLSQMVHSRSLILNGYSHYTSPRPNDWPPNAIVTGYWYLDGPRSYTPDPALDSFMRSGPVPICLTFGSEVGQSASTSLAFVLRCALSRGYRVVVVAGWMNPTTLPTDSNCFVADSVSYEWLFPKVRCVVHHSGTGTVAEILRAGVPSVCIPFHGEQRYWADRLSLLGVASESLDFRHLSEANIVAALTAATSDARIAARAEELGQNISNEAGIASAVRYIDEFLMGQTGSDLAPINATE